MNVQNPITPQADRYIEALADDLAVGEARYEQAVRSYELLGCWLHRPASTVREYNPQVYAQGSFALGTVIKPITDQEDYDVDSVCEFLDLNTQSGTQKQIKQLLGLEVSAYHDAQAMTKPVREGRRCWVLDYADGAQFHMDIVPAVSNAVRQQNLLKSAGLTNPFAGTSIAITDNERWNYEALHDDWCRSNPKGFVQWFRQRMAVELRVRREALAKALYATVEDIPEYRVRTPLQSAIMILKRHRDLRFADEPTSRPISIILTTLAAHAYQSERTVAEALLSILTNMDRYIETENGRYVIRNPTDPLENFADKWADHPERARAFFAWLVQARTDFAELAKLSDERLIADSAAPTLGRSLAERAINRATAGRGLLRSATAAPAGLAFPNRPRTPNEPQGFA